MAIQIMQNRLIGIAENCIIDEKFLGVLMPKMAANLNAC